jgi:hypothetical protein
MSEIPSVPGTCDLPGIGNDIPSSPPVRELTEEKKVREISSSSVGRIDASVIICRCGVSSKDMDVRDRYVQFVLPHWRTCRVESDRFIVDCMRWE